MKAKALSRFVGQDVTLSLRTGFAATGFVGLLDAYGPEGDDDELFAIQDSRSGVRDDREHFFTADAVLTVSFLDADGNITPVDREGKVEAA